MLALAAVLAVIFSAGEKQGQATFSGDAGEKSSLSLFSGDGGAVEGPDAGEKSSLSLFSEVVPPRADCPPPVYPPLEKGSGVRGAALLRVSLSAGGEVQGVEVVRELGGFFDQAAREVVARCTFHGARVRGQPAPSVLELTVEFVPDERPWVLTGEVVGELGEALAGARISFGEREVVADARGAFTLSFAEIPSGDAWVTVEKEGYALRGFPEQFEPGKTTRVRYRLTRQRGMETRVEGSRLLPALPDADRTPQVSRTTITRADVDRLPGAMEDVLRVVHTAPGVVADSDLLATMSVRGGGPDELVVYLDGVPLSNPFHLGGYASVVNPMLIESADFFAGGAPARYEPSLSGVLDVRYASAEVKKPHVAVDVSIQSAKVRADVPLGLPGLSATAAFRRSYFELYFEILKALGLIGSSVVAPELTEAFGRVSFKRGAHQTLATFIHASDGMSFASKPGEPAGLGFAGGLKLANSAQVASVQHRLDLAGDSGLEATVAYVRDENHFSVTSARRYATVALRHEVLARADLVLAHSGRHRTQAGGQYAWRLLRLDGDVSDHRGRAPWTDEPWLETWRPYVAVSPRLESSLLALYAEHTWRPFEWLALEAGGRGQYDTAQRRFTGSARAAGAVTLPTATVVKASLGFAAQPVQSPLQLDPTAGNPRLEPERVVTLVGALEQPLPIEALVKLEGWGKWMSALAVNPDTPAALEERLAAGERAYESLGTGRAWGADALVVGRARYFSYSLTFSLLFTERTNPLAAGRRTYPTAWDQNVSLSGQVSFSPNSRWLFSVRAAFHTGRPHTEVLGFVRDDGGQRFLPVFGPSNGARYPPFFELALRVEQRFRVGPLGCGIHVELLNVTNTQNVFVYAYGGEDYARNVAPIRQSFNHLPLRPFVGLTAEY